MKGQSRDLKRRILRFGRHNAEELWDEFAVYSGSSCVGPERLFKVVDVTQRTAPLRRTAEKY